MIPRAWFFAHRIDVDPDTKRAAIVPVRAPAIVAAAALAVTPAALGAAHARLSTAGWVFLVAYGLLTIGALAMVVGPSHRRIEIAFDGRSPRPFAIGKEARALAEVVASARSFQELDGAAAKAGREPMKQAIMSLALLVLPGWMFAWAAWR